MSPIRLALAVASGLAMVALAGWSMGLGRIDGPARVEAPTEFRVVHTGDGVVRWSLLDGTVPGGPVVVTDGVLQGERGDLLELERLGELSPGARVQAGTALMRVRSSRLEEETAVLAAEVQALSAEEALLQAGGRPETVARAQQEVEVAQANLALARAQVEHVDGLVARGAEAAWVAEEARRVLEVRQAELDLARAAREEARLPPRAPELDALQARRAALEARLGGAQGRLDGVSLASPIDGRIALPGADTLLSVQGDGTAVLQVAVDEGWRERLSVGDPVRFVATSRPERPVAGRVQAIGGVASGLGGEPVVWVVAALDEPVPVGATGTARIEARGGTP